MKKNRPPAHISVPRATESFTRQRKRAIARAARKEHTTKTQRHEADRAIGKAIKDARRS